MPLEDLSDLKPVSRSTLPKNNPNSNNAEVRSSTFHGGAVINEGRGSSINGKIRTSASSAGNQRPYIRRFLAFCCGERLCCICDLIWP